MTEGTRLAHDGGAGGRGCPKGGGSREGLQRARTAEGGTDLVLDVGLRASFEEIDDRFDLVGADGVAEGRVAVLHKQRVTVNEEWRNPETRAGTARTSSRTFGSRRNSRSIRMFPASAALCARFYDSRGRGMCAVWRSRSLLSLCCGCERRCAARSTFPYCTIAGHGRNVRV